MMAYVFLALGMAALAVFCVLRDRRSSMEAIAFKTLASLLFVATAVAALMSRECIEGILTPALLMIGGLVCGLVGDITLDFKIFLQGLTYPKAERDADTMTYVGMAAFGIGHILYITATALRYPDMKLNLLWSALVAVALVAAIFVVSIRIMHMRFGRFLIPSISYALLLAWFVVFSIWQLAAAGGSTAGILLLLGSILFIVSDLILSVTYFSKPEDYRRTDILHPESKLMIVSNHVTYYFAQFLIALAIMFI